VVVALPQGSGLVIRLSAIDPRIRELKGSVHHGERKSGGPSLVDNAQRGKFVRTISNAVPNFSRAAATNVGIYWHCLSDLIRVLSEKSGVSSLPPTMIPGAGIRSLMMGNPEVIAGQIGHQFEELPLENYGQSVRIPRSVTRPTDNFVPVQGEPKLLAGPQNVSQVRALSYLQIVQAHDPVTSEVF